jgi:hypothetical protein
MNEKDLHYNIIKIISNIIPDALIVPGLGENQIHHHLDVMPILKAIVVDNLIFYY